ncbi:1-deoxy-D-xylulose-5-phosphate synthase [Klebsiella pneumoniae]|uniref:1-deoxy-D-xylulose-5-phosphate synthase n=1 Tax=Klebsiella pneumoniae TaxID=573 RepID=A0A447S1C0_KLEPN|nr:1-deoxy-D-xylulose-5-phosphate synthase [Klebsiella pneumoniae]
MSFDIAKYPTLALVDSTQELRLLPKESLPKLCDELRRYLLDSVSRSSGHFASGLGTVELTVALHYVYNTPFDRLIWDVGHQAYPHKILDRSPGQNRHHSSERRPASLPVAR